MSSVKFRFGDESAVLGLGFLYNRFGEISSQYSSFKSTGTQDSYFAKCRDCRVKNGVCESNSTQQSQISALSL
ncbi:hypothetical protein F2Q69_00024014 [Brassica cretica]|uniref:Uncharacterized protein n=1 Tax=Brassica cretica TaxID=69181 RepID=A0A8S9Q3T7_BRACR|nr:hypothetical protein F2Q69_00024014 [Brassica cretica]